MITGTSQSENIWVDNNQEAQGLEGNDIFMAARSYISNATVDGGLGDDYISDANWHDLTAYGGDGNDTLTGGYAGGTLYGETGNDTIHLKRGEVWADAGPGDDVFNVQLPATLPVLQVPNWDLYASAFLGNSTLIGGDGVDTLRITGGSDLKVVGKTNNNVQSLQIHYLTDKSVTIGISLIEQFSVNGQMVSFATLSGVEPSPIASSLHFWNTKANTSEHYPIAGVSLRDSNAFAGATITSDSKGGLSLPGSISNSLGIQLEKPTADDVSVKSAISLSDVLDTLKLYLGKTLTNMSPYKYVAADLNGSGALELSDVLDLLKFYLGKSPTSKPAWVFLDANASLASLDPKSIQLPPLEVLADTSSTVELVGILRGDVNGSWVPADAV